MTAWLIRADAPSIEVRENQRSIVITTRRRPRMMRGDVLILRDSMSGLGKVRKATVESVSEKREPGDGLFVIVHTEWQPESTAVSIEDQLFSLTFVRNVQHPMRHFRRGYRRIPEGDVTTLLKGEVFFARTVFYRLLSALPQETQNAFLAEELVRGLPAARENPWRERARHLSEFIASRVVAVATRFLELSRTIDSLEFRSSGRAEISHAILDGESAVRSEEIDVTDQAMAFKRLTSAVAGDAQLESMNGDTNFFAAIEAELSALPEPASQSRFESIFGGTL